MLRAGGPLAIFEHAYEPPREVAEPFAAAYRQAAPHSPFDREPARRPLSVYQAGCAKFVDQLRGTGLFDGPEQWRFDWERSCTREEWLDLLPTTDGLTQLPTDRTTDVLDAVGAAIDGLGGRFTMRVTTLAMTAISATHAT